MFRRCLAGLLLIGGWSSGVSADNTPLLVINDTNAPPFTTPAQDGFLDIVTREALRRAGARLELTKLPAERALLSANAGEIDGDLTRIKGLQKQYPNLIPVQEKLVDWEFSAFSKDPSIPATWPAIRAKTVGHITGWKIYEKATYGSNNVVRATTPKQLFRLLALDRIDVALHARWMGHHHFGSMRLHGVRELTPPLAKHEMFIYLNKRHAELAEQIAQALRDLKQEGFYQQTWDQTVGPYSSQTAQNSPPPP